MLGACNVMTKRRLWTAAVALCLAVCLCISLSSCKKDKDTDQQATGTTAAAEKVTYTIEVVTEGEMPLENVGIYIYTDDTLEELVWFAKTDASGKITFADAASDSYVAVLSNVPEGYHVGPGRCRRFHQFLGKNGWCSSSPPHLWLYRIHLRTEQRWY